MKTIDLRGQPCPIPVIQAKKALSATGVDGVNVLVDNFVAIQNLKKMADGLGYTFSYTTESDNCYNAQILLNGAQPPTTSPSPAPLPQIQKSGVGSTVLISSDHLGEGSEDLGKILIKGFLFALSELPTVPTCILFLNSGVKLTIETANTIDDLRSLEKQGTKIRVCGTCLNYYGLTDKLAVGEITDMFGIITALDSAERLITL